MAKRVVVFLNSEQQVVEVLAPDDVEVYLVPIEDESDTGGFARFVYNEKFEYYDEIEDDPTGLE